MISVSHKTAQKSHNTENKQHSLFVTAGGMSGKCPVAGNGSVTIMCQKAIEPEKCMLHQKQN